MPERLEYMDLCIPSCTIILLVILYLRTSFCNIIWIKFIVAAQQGSLNEKERAGATQRSFWSRL